MPFDAAAPSHPIDVIIPRNPSILPRRDTLHHKAATFVRRESGLGTRACGVAALRAHSGRAAGGAV